MGPLIIRTLVFWGSISGLPSFGKLPYIPYIFLDMGDHHMQLVHNSSLFNKSPQGPKDGRTVCTLLDHA